MEGQSKFLTLLTITKISVPTNAKTAQKTLTLSSDVTSGSSGLCDVNHTGIRRDLFFKIFSTPFPTPENSPLNVPQSLRLRVADFNFCQISVYDTKQKPSGTGISPIHSRARDP